MSRGVVRTSIGAQVEQERRLRELPRRCEALFYGFDNADNDPALIFDGLPYVDVMAAAQRHEIVARALQYYRSRETVPFGPDPIGISWADSPPPSAPRRATMIQPQAPHPAEPAFRCGKTLIVEGL